MIKHLVLWKLRADVSETDKAALVASLGEKFARMCKEIPGLSSAQVAQNLDENEPYALILSAEFSDAGALEGYQNHPLHLALKNDMQNTVEGRLVFDYRTEE